MVVEPLTLWMSMCLRRPGHAACACPHPRQPRYPPGVRGGGGARELLGEAAEAVTIECPELVVTWRRGVDVDYRPRAHGRVRGDAPGHVGPDGLRWSSEASGTATGTMGHAGARRASAGSHSGHRGAHRATGAPESAAAAPTACANARGTAARLRSRAAARSSVHPTTGCAAGASRGTG